MNNEEGSESGNGATSSCVGDARRGFLKPGDRLQNRLQSEHRGQDRTEVSADRVSGRQGSIWSSTHVNVTPRPNTSPHIIDQPQAHIASTAARVVGKV